MFGTTTSKPAPLAVGCQTKNLNLSKVSRHHGQPVATITDRGSLLRAAVKGFDRGDFSFSPNFIFFLDSFSLYLSLPLSKPSITKHSVLLHFFSFLLHFHPKSFHFT